LRVGNAIKYFGYIAEKIIAMLRLAVVGYGKMGHEVEAMALERGHEVILRIDRENAHELTPERLQFADVAIEFSSPQSAKANVEACLNAGVPVVCGTTGWVNELEELTKRVRAGGGTLFYASNYSVGVNVMFKISALLARYLDKIGGYSVGIKEIHHLQKLDAPSGTAITIAGKIAEEIPSITGWTLLPKREDGKIPIEAIREGTVPGTHIISFSSDQDSILFTHEAKSRRGFALGAVMAAEFLYNKVGFFTMDDLLAFD